MIFSNTEMLFIYGHFKKEVKKLESLKSTPNCPVDKKSINQEIKLFSSITDKIDKEYPQFSAMHL